MTGQSKRQRETGQLAKYVVASTNKKTGATDVTYVSLQSCPECPFAGGEGCYAENYPAAFTVAPLAREGAKTSDIAKAEADAIDASYNGGKVPYGRALRLHISGDSRTKTAAKTVSAAVKRWQGRGGGPAWSYTHAWRKVPKEAWGTISVLASVEQAVEAKEAFEHGYAPAIVIDTFPNGPKSFVKDDVRFIPCPAQTSDKTCDQCELCWDADALHKRKTGIAFEAHGTKTKVIKRRLAVLQGDT
jgi:hypothetical protein